MDSSLAIRGLMDTLLSKIHGPTPNGTEPALVGFA
jgi:hypothetical protein